MDFPPGLVRKDWLLAGQKGLNVAATFPHVSLGSYIFLLLSFFTDLRGHLHTSDEMRYKMLLCLSRDRDFGAFLQQ